MQLAPTYLCSLGNLGDTRMFGERGDGQERYARARRARSKTGRANHYFLIAINHHYQLQIILYLSATTYTNGVVLTKFYSHIRPVKGGEYSEVESRKSDQNPHLEGGGAYGWRISFSEFVFPATLLEHVGLLVGPSFKVPGLLA